MVLNNSKSSHGLYNSWLDTLSDSLSDLDTAHVRRKRRIVIPGNGAYITVIDKIDDKQMNQTNLIDSINPVNNCSKHDLLAFCNNDYLGLSQHPDLIEAACHTAKTLGIGSGASPLVSGHSLENQLLEEELAKFIGLPRALYFYAGYAANIGIIPALVGLGDAIFSDQLNHACLIDGARLSKANVYCYTHQNLAELEGHLKHSSAKRKLIISDAVFSMDGSVADIVGLYALSERYDALLLLDDAHGFGVLGNNGSGSLMHVGLAGEQFKRRILYMATLGKAAGVAGAFVAGDSTLIEWLMQKTRTYLFATAAPALLASSIRASIQVMKRDSWRYAYLQYLINYFKHTIQCILLDTVSNLSSQHSQAVPSPANLPKNLMANWQLLPSNTPIQPLIIGNNEQALQVMHNLWDQGFWVPAIRPPTVPIGTARLRITLSCLHTTQDIDRLIQALLHIKTTINPNLS